MYCPSAAPHRPLWGGGYEDGPLVIVRGQVTPQPSIVAAIVEALELSGEEQVLEVRTGLGRQSTEVPRAASREDDVARRRARSTTTLTVGGGRSGR